MLDFTPKAKVMVVDDFKPWRLKLSSMLEGKWGFRVVAEAGDGVEAIEKAAQLLPDIVFLDISMPLLNGLKAAPEILRASPESKIIFLTQENDEEIKAAAVAAGAEAYLLKSCAASELKRAVDTALLGLYRHQVPNSNSVPYPAGG